MIVDALQRLQAAGFSISDYQYTGFGAIYFVDFILLHKLLGMNRLVSLEHQASLERRIQFNKPYKCVEVKMAPASSEIPNLSRDIAHIVWLDYDGVLRSDFLADIQSAITVLCPGSILLVTVDLEPPEEHDYKEIDSTFDGSKNVMGPKQWKRYFEHHASRYLGLHLTESDFGRVELRTRTAEVLQACFKGSIAPRRHMEFLPMFNFIYRDSHWMLSIGGMIGGEAEKRKVRGSTLGRTRYYRNAFSTPPFEISVPRLTRKERMYLDQDMPCEDNWVPGGFEIDPVELQRYRDIYRFLPSFAEIFV
jgi:hypothetical protein